MDLLVLLDLDCELLDWSLKSLFSGPNGTVEGLNLHFLGHFTCN